MKVEHVIPVVEDHETRLNVGKIIFFLHGVALELPIDGISRLFTLMPVLFGANFDFRHEGLAIGGVVLLNLPDSLIDLGLGGKGLFVNLLVL